MAGSTARIYQMAVGEKCVCQGAENTCVGYAQVLGKNLRGQLPGRIQQSAGCPAGITDVKEGFFRRHLDLFHDSRMVLRFASLRVACRNYLTLPFISKL